MAVANTDSLVTNFNVAPYYDDFDESKNFHRMLFRPGYAVQARELTQMQSILQNQIDRFGEHVFREGSIVTGIELNYDTKATYIKIRDNNASGNNVVANSFLNTTITGSTSNTTAIVIGTDTGSEAETPNLKTLFIKYTSTGTSNSGNNYFTLGETITSNTSVSANVASTVDSVGVGSKLTVGEGIIFAKDHFIRIPAQEIVVGKYSTNADYKVGFNLTETIVTADNDPTLKDPASGSYNYTAPGANRLKLTGTLSKYTLTANTGTDFVELLRIENGIIQRKVDKPQYAEIKDFVNRRTKEINGDFIVRGLSVRLREHLNQANNKGVFTAGDGGNSTLLSVDVEPGKAYVNGAEVENIVTKHVPIQKSTNYESVEALNVSANYGNYVVVKEVAGAWDVNAHKKVTIYNGYTRAASNNTFSTATPAGTAIGTARVRAIEYVSGTKGSSEARYNLYLYDINMTGGAFSSAKSIFIDNSTESQANGIADIVSSTINEIDFNRTIFKVPADNIRRLRDVNGNIDTNFQFVKKFDVTIATDGTFSLATGAVDETFPFSTGALNTTQKQSGFYVVLNANTVSSSAVAAGSVTAGANSITGITGASTKFNVGDEIRLENMSNTLIVTSVGSSTLSTLTGAPIAATTENIFKVFNKGQVIDMSGVGGDGAARTVTVASSTSASFDLQEALNNTVSATVITELTKVDGQEIAKGYRSNRYVQVTVNKPDGSANTTGPWDLGLSDVHKIIEVRRNTGNTVFTTATEGTDVTNNFELDNGQTDNLYKHGKLRLKGSSTASSGDVYLVKLNYFNHDTSQGVGYFSVDSYPIDDTNAANTTAITTQEIPLFTSQVTGTTYNLRDSIDIRPRITDTAADSTTVGSATVNPPSGNTTIVSPAGGLRYMAPNENLTADLDYYLKRRDVVTLSPSGDFVVTPGMPSLNPVYPNEPEGHLPIAKVDVSPYPSVSPEVGKQYSRTDLSSRVFPTRTEVFTMRDIGSLKNRIDKLEYFTRLSLLEQEAKNLNFADGSGVDRFKNGIIVDTFTGHKIGNVFNADYKASIDRKKGELRPSFKLNNVDLDYKSANSSNLLLGPKDATITVGGTDTFTVGETVTAGAASGKLVYQVDRKLYLENVSGTFTVSATATGGSSTSSGTISAVSTPGNGKYLSVPYTHEKVIQQSFATTSRVAAGLFWNFLGNITLSPDQDYWVDTTVAPEVQVNFDMNYDNWEFLASTWETEWNNWQTVSSGSSSSGSRWLEDFADGGNGAGINIFRNTVTTTTTSTQTRTGIEREIVPETVEQRIGNRVIDTNVIPFMRSRVIQVTGRGFKPNTRLYAFFDGTAVSDYITPTNSSFANTAVEGSNLVTDTNGDVYAEFRIPNNDGLRFRVGEKIFRLTDNSTNATGIGLTTTSGEANYAAQGLVQTVQDTVISTRVPRIVANEVSDSRTITSSSTVDTGTRSGQIVGIPNVSPDIFNMGSGAINVVDASGQRTLPPLRQQPVDPIAQTFTVTNFNNTGLTSGVFLTKLDLYFATKDSSRPVFIEIREVDATTNSITPKILPFSNITLEASDINTSANGSKPTLIHFPTPVHLVNGATYAIVVKPGANNPNTSLFISKLGGTDLVTGQRVNQQPYVGDLFASSNDRSWSPIYDEDLKFNLYIASFTTGQVGTAIFKNEDREFFKINGSNTFNTIGETINGPTTIINNSVLSVNANMVLVGNTSGANGLVTSQSSNTIIVNNVSLNDKFTAGERVNVVINGIKQEPHAIVHSVATPTGKVSYFDNVNSVGNTFLHIDNASGTFTVGDQLKGQKDGNTTTIDSIDKLEIDTLQLNNNYLGFEGTYVVSRGKFASSAAARETSFRVLEQNENTPFSAPRYILSKSLETSGISSEKSGEIEVTFVTNNNRVAPMIDTERVNLIVVDNNVNNDTTGEDSVNGGNAEARYITRTLTLADGQDAEDLKVRLNAYKPSGTGISVYYKILNKDDDDAFEDRSWVEMTQTTLSTVVSSSENYNDFIVYDYGIPAAQLTGGSNEVQYVNSQGITYTGYKYIAVKVVMTSSSDSIVPRVKDLMAIALQV
jgi:hypothetical protein